MNQEEINKVLDERETNPSYEVPDLDVHVCDLNKINGCEGTATGTLKVEGYDVCSICFVANLEDGQ